MHHLQTQWRPGGRRLCPVSYPPPANFERGHPMFAPRTLVDTPAVAVFRAGQVLVTAAHHVRSPTRGLIALARNANTAEQVEYTLAVARRVKVKLTKACLLEFCFGEGHFASSLSSRCRHTRNSPSAAMPVSTATTTMVSSRKRESFGRANCTVMQHDRMYRSILYQRAHCQACSRPRRLRRC